MALTASALGQVGTVQARGANADQKIGHHRNSDSGTSVICKTSASRNLRTG
jgi:hypothetical protein